jgi:hypothetical protein
MSAPQAARNSAAGPAANAKFFLYVEGPGDECILRIWARRISRSLARQLDSRVVILGGRRPARAQEHFRAEGGPKGGGRGLVVLDRDHHSESGGFSLVEPGLEVFTWKRRHIESYALVPDAIRRSLRKALEPRLLERLLEEYVPSPEDEAACRVANAKKILGSKGALARSAGGHFSPVVVARAMRIEELHPDVLALFDRVRQAAGLEEPSQTSTRSMAALESRSH